MEGVGLYLYRNNAPPRSRVPGLLTSVFERSVAPFGNGGGGILARGSRLGGWWRWWRRRLSAGAGDGGGRLRYSEGMLERRRGSGWFEG